MTETITVRDRIRRETRGDGHILDLTDDLARVVRESGVVTGHATAMVVGSTAALTTLEYEPGLVDHDVVAALEKVAPEDGTYRHEETWNDDNGHSHVRMAYSTGLARPRYEELVPRRVVDEEDREIPFGTWQQPVLVDFDTRPRERTVVVTVTGEAG